MNIILSILFLTLGVVALKSNMYVFFGALALTATLVSPRAWPYTVGAALGMLLLKVGRFPSWDVLSFLIIGTAYGLMSRIEEKKEPERVPPELMYYYLLGGGRR